MKKTSAVFVSLLLTWPAFGYVQRVHRVITEEAFRRLQIDFRQKLGIDEDLDLSGEKPQLLMSDGADDEDNMARSINHFFDPIHDAPLSVWYEPACLPVPTSVTAPVWALSGTALWPSPTGTDNRYNLGAARNHYFNAVVSTNKRFREFNAARLFYDLGHIVHLVQDMAQPEHVRNDQHLPHTNFFLFDNGLDASLYEEWGQANIGGDGSLIDFGGYPTVALPNYASYFHTSDLGLNGQPRGRGLADYANRNFVTQDTNYGDYMDPLKGRCFRYLQPRFEDAARRTEVVTERVRIDEVLCCKDEVVEEEVYTSSLVDYYAGSIDLDPFHTYVSALDIETRKYDPTSDSSR